MADGKELIIVAEDSPPNRKILVHLLEKLGYEVEGYENGAKAIQALKDESKGNLVAILSDIMMPEMDGIEFLKEIRSNDSTKDLPFVLITAVSDKEYIVEAKAHQVNGYILKPVTFDRVTNKLKELFP